MEILDLRSLTDKIDAYPPSSIKLTFTAARYMQFRDETPILSIPDLRRCCFVPFIERENTVKDSSLLPYFSRVICGGLIYKFNEEKGGARVQRPSKFRLFVVAELLIRKIWRQIFSQLSNL